MILLLILAGVGAILYAKRDPLLHAFGEWWVVQEPPVKSEAIVVLGGDSVEGARVEHAVALYRQGWAPKLVLSGPMLRTDFSEAQLMDAQARRMGVPERDIIKVPALVDSTVAEALELRRFLAEHEMHRVILVTSDYHTRRARMIWQKVLGESGFDVNVSAAPDLRLATTKWWERREGLKVMTLELLKLPESWWELRDVAPLKSPPDQIPRRTPEAQLLPGSRDPAAGASHQSGLRFRLDRRPRAGVC